MSTTFLEPAAGAVAVASTVTSSSAASDHGNPINGRVFLRENCNICHGGRAGDLHAWWQPGAPSG